MSEQTMLHCSVHGRHTGTICPACNIGEIAALRDERDQLKKLNERLERNLAAAIDVLVDHDISVPEQLKTMSAVLKLHNENDKLKSKLADAESGAAACRQALDIPQMVRRLVEQSLKSVLIGCDGTNDAEVLQWNDKLNAAFASNSGRKITERLQAAEKCIDTLWRELSCTDVVGWVISDQSKEAYAAWNSLK